MVMVELQTWVLYPSGPIPYSPPKSKLVGNAFVYALCCRL